MKITTWIARVAEKYGILGEPQRPREKATRALQGSLIATLAEHMMKVLVYGHLAQERKKWVGDIARQMRQLTFELSKKSARKSPQDRTDHTLVFREMHFPARVVMRALDAETSDAYKSVLENPDYSKLPVEEPEGIEDGVFSTLGYKLEDSKGDLGVGFRLTLNGDVLVDTSSSSAKT